MNICNVIASVIQTVPKCEMLILIECREKLALFTELADIFNDNDNQKLCRELLNRVSWSEIYCKTFGIIDYVLRIML